MIVGAPPHVFNLLLELVIYQGLRRRLGRLATWAVGKASAASCWLDEGDDKDKSPARTMLSRTSINLRRFVIQRGEGETGSGSGGGSRMRARPRPSRDRPDHAWITD